jgi:hypothetical protein
MDEDVAARCALERRMLDEARTEVGIADHKASMVLAAIGVAFGAVLGGLLANDWRPSKLEGFGKPLWWVAAVMVLSAVSAAGLAVWPRYSKASTSAGVHYWGHVVTFASEGELFDALDRQPPDDLARTRHQLWHMSRVVDRKYRCVRWALGLSAIASLLFLLSVALGA